MRVANRMLGGAILMAALLLVVCFRAASAQTGTLSGTVSDSVGAVLPGAEVRLDGTTLHTTTDDKGHYALANVPAGTYTLRALMLGFRAATQSVTVADGSSAEVNFTLRVSPIEVQGVEVVVGSRAQHTAADELAVPVDVYSAEDFSGRAPPRPARRCRRCRRRSTSRARA